jgi:hypothetical protein
VRQHLARVGGAAAVGGAVALVIGTLLHPLGADPNNPTEAFAEYAADRMWVASHLLQFLGVAGLGAALVALAGIMDTGRASAWARIGAFGAAAGVATAAALQAVDGVALKVMVDRWAGATGDARALAFEGALAVRQIEVGLASLLSVLFGLTMLAFSVALLFSRRFGAWLGWLGVVGGSGTLVAGVAQAHAGFSPVAMTISMAASSVLILWALAVGIAMWRLAPQLSDTDVEI